MDVVIGHTLREDERLFRIDWSFNGKHPAAGSWYFAVKNTIPQREEKTKLLEAIKAHYQTLGEDERNGNPDWGMAIAEINDELLEKAGFRMLPMPWPKTSIHVKLDEEVYKYED